MAETNPPRTTQCYLDGLTAASKLVYDEYIVQHPGQAKRALEVALKRINEAKSNAAALGVENTLFMLNETRLALAEETKRAALWKEEYGKLHEASKRQGEYIDAAIKLVVWLILAAVAGPALVLFIC